MKKLLGIVVLGLLWCNLSFANIDDLDIPIMKAEFETEIIKPNKEYRQSCETTVYIEEYDFILKFNSYVDVNGKKQTLVNEAIFDLEEEGKFIIKSKQKIKSDGTLSKIKASSDYIPGSVEYSKKDINQIKKVFKIFAKNLDQRAINYGEKLTLEIKHEDPKKEMLKLLKDMERLFPNEDAKEVKEFLKIVKKDLEFEYTKEYLGTTKLNGEKFYAIRWKTTLKYVGNIPEMKEILEEFGTSDQIYFIHAPSGYRSAVKTLIQTDESPTEAFDDMVCTIYKNDQMLTEVSLWSWSAKKVEPKEKTEVLQKEFMCIEIAKGSYNHGLSYSRVDIIVKGTAGTYKKKVGKDCDLKIELEKHKKLYDKLKTYWDENQKNNLAEFHHLDVIKFTKGTSFETEYLEKR